MASLMRRDKPGGIDPDRVLLLTGATQTSENAHVTAFLSDPTLEVNKSDVIIATPTLQAGHSIEEHIGKSSCRAKSQMDHLDHGPFGPFGITKIDMDHLDLRWSPT